MVNPIPEGTHTVTPHLVVRGGARAIEFYKQAFGAVEARRHTMPDGSVMHAEIRIGDSPVYIADENPAWGALSPLALGGSPVTIHLFLPDADAAVERAVQAGATVRMPLSDAFWGDRYGQIGDPFGHVWSIATHVEDVSAEELERRAQEAFAAMPAPEPVPVPEPRAEAPARPAARRSRPAARRSGKKVAKKAVRKAGKKVARKKVAKKAKKASKKASRKKVTRKAARKTAKKAGRKKASARKTRKPAKKSARRRAGRDKK